MMRLVVDGMSDGEYLLDGGGPHIFTILIDMNKMS